MLPSFPKFARLTLDDKASYEALVSAYPPFSDISFATLHIWWNLDGQLAISTLSKNLVINYQLPFDKLNSGYSLIGTNQIDESLRTIFAYLYKHQKVARLVHVPEFTVEKIQAKDDLTIEEELDYHEYIMDAKALASLEGHGHSRTRRKVRRFLREVEGQKLELKSVDLAAPEIKDQLFKAVVAWQKKYPKDNDPENTESKAISTTLRHALALDTQNLCIFINDELHGLVLYHRSTDKKHFIINHLKVDYGYPHIFDYLNNQIAVRAVKQNVAFLNMEMDLGVEGLRRHKAGLRPVHFLKKYTVALK